MRREAKEQKEFKKYRRYIKAAQEADSSANSRARLTNRLALQALNTVNHAIPRPSGPRHKVTYVWSRWYQHHYWLSILPFIQIPLSSSAPPIGRYLTTTTTNILAHDYVVYQSMNQSSKLWIPKFHPLMCIQMYWSSLNQSFLFHTKNWTNRVSLHGCVIRIKINHKPNHDHGHDLNRFWATANSHRCCEISLFSPGKKNQDKLFI